MQEFFIEFNDISNGFSVNFKSLLLQIHSIACDTPSLARIKSTKGHTGYGACFKYTTKGIQVVNLFKKTYPDFDFPIRTNE